MKVTREGHGPSVSGVGDPREKKMTNKTLIVLVIAIALLVSAMIYMHRPRSGTSARTLAPHGTR